MSRNLRPPHTDSYALAWLVPYVFYQVVFALVYFGVTVLAFGQEEPSGAVLFAAFVYVALAWLLLRLWTYSTVLALPPEERPTPDDFTRLHHRTQQWAIKHTRQIAGTVLGLTLFNALCTYGATSHPEQPGDIAAFLAVIEATLFLWVLNARTTHLRREANENEIHDRQVAADAKRAQQLQLSDQTRRENARAKCLLRFLRLAPELGDRFTRAMLDEYAEKYMGDKQPPEIVEDRGRRLRALLEQHRNGMDTKTEFSDIESLTRWFQTQQKRIEGLPVDTMLRSEYVRHLHHRYDELMQKLLKKI